MKLIHNMFTEDRVLEVYTCSEISMVIISKKNKAQYPKQVNVPLQVPHEDH